MKRHKPMPRSTTPMKRAPFKGKPAKVVSTDEAKHLDTPIAAASNRLRVTVAAARMLPILNDIMNPQPKFNYVRSTAIQMACRTIPCQAPAGGGVKNTFAEKGMICGETNGVHWSHSNSQIHGHGRGIKSSDIFVASMCWRCHRELDQGNLMTEPQKQLFWWLSHQRTIARLVANGSWPASAPIPDVIHYPFPVA